MSVGVPAAEAVDTDIAIDTTTLNFGQTNVGNTSPPMSVTLTNTGADPFGPINIFGGAPPTAEFNASQNCQGTTLPAGGSCNVNYTFATVPRTVHRHLRLHHQRDGEPVRRGGFLGQSRGCRSQPDHGRSARHNFGSVIVGTTDQPMTTVIADTSTANFGPINIFGGAPPTAEFNTSQNPARRCIARRWSCNVNYTFSPTAPGVFNDVSAFTISATASQAAGVDFSVALTGCGAVVGGQCPLPDVTLNPGSLSVTLAPQPEQRPVIRDRQRRRCPAQLDDRREQRDHRRLRRAGHSVGKRAARGGSTAPGGASNVDVTFNSTGLAPGTYQARLCVDSNDPDEQQLTVALTLTVSQSVVAEVPTLSPLALLAFAGLLVVTAALILRP